MSQACAFSPSLRAGERDAPVFTLLRRAIPATIAESPSSAAVVEAFPAAGGCLQHDEVARPARGLLSLSRNIAAVNTDETAIIDYLRGCRNAFVSGREIARRAGGKRRYEEDKSWASRVLRGMVSKGWLEMDSIGHFRFPQPEDAKKKKGQQRHLLAPNAPPARKQRAEFRWCQRWRGRRRILTRRGFHASGSVKKNAAPAPGSLLTQTSPWCA